MSKVVDEHERAQEITRHQVQIDTVRRRARHWRLIDCDEEALVRMRHALIEEIEAVEAQLKEADRHFLLFVDKGRPLDAEQTLRQINRLGAEWEGLHEHLQEVDDALLERQLRARLARALGGMRWLNLLDATVFVSIIVVVSLTVLEFLLPLSPATVAWIVWADTIIALFLIADFFFRLTLAPDRGWYFRNYWIDLVASIPFYEVLRFGRLVRIVRFARLLRLIRLGRAMRLLSYSFRGLDKLVETFQVNLLKRSMLIAFALLIFGALSISSLEGVYETSLLSLRESLWWSFTTVVTGGFADLYNPETLFGRYLTVGLVLLGLTVTGIFTASLTSVLVDDDSTLIRENQQELELKLQDLGQKLDLLSGETNEGLIALETVGQALSNQLSSEGVAQVLAEAVVEHFQGVQASVHLLDGERLLRLAEAGDGGLSPPPELQVGDGFVGHVAAALLAQGDAAELDLEPDTELTVDVRGMAMACPLVAGHQVLGVLHLVLPDTLARYYLYNRAPMTLAHHAAIAFYAMGRTGGVAAV
ncbi:MAG: ion transporter [Candidatus Promineifilaceae bacterium]|nr:ion transporter [Candidatus Promineifilaceae bacterium]